MNAPALSLPAFIATNFASTCGYNKNCGSYFLKHRWEEYQHSVGITNSYAGMENDFIQTLRQLGFKVNKKNQLKLRPI